MILSGFIRNIRLGIKNLMLHGLRSLLTVLGVVFGVGSVIAMLAVGEGTSAQAMEQLRKLGSNNIIIRAQKPVEDQQSGGSQRSFVSVYGLLYEDHQRIRATLPSVATAVPAKIVSKETSVGGRWLDLRVVGTTPEWFELVERRLVAGRVLRWGDLENNAAVCVLTEQGARKLLAAEQAVGKVVRVGSDTYEVVGVVASEAAGGEIATPDGDTDAYVPLNVARARMGDIWMQRTSGSDIRELVELHMILVRVRDTEQVEATEAAIRALLARFHKKNDYEIKVPLALLRQREATKRTFNIALGSIAGISLLVGGIGIMNIMLASVTERTREIGIRRAIGAKRRQIVSQFLIETTVLSVVGGVLGLGVGWLFPWMIESFFGMPTIIPAYAVVLSLCISAGIGLLFGIYPAIRAARLDPIEALRHE